MKNKIIILLLISLTFYSCKSYVEKIRESNNLENCSNYLIERINLCHEGSNQIEVEQKAEFDSSSKTIILFIGKSKNDYIEKWEIPLKELDEEATITEVTSDYFSFQVYTSNMNEKIRYYNNGGESELQNQHNFYLPDYCFKQKERIKFIETFKRSIKLSKI